MRIAISLLNFRPGRVGGTESFLRHLVPALAAEKGSNELVLVSCRDNAGEFQVPGVTEVLAQAGDRQLVWARAAEAFSFYRACGIERLFREIRPDVVFFPQQSIFPKRLSFPAVVTVHDLQHLALPGNFSLTERLFRACIYPYSLKRAAHLIAISEFTRREVLKNYALPEDRITTIPHGFTPAKNAAREPVPNLPANYWYYPAASFRHKNHLALFRSLAELRRRGECNFHLVLSGWQTPYWPALDRARKELGLANTVQHLGFLSPGQVETVYDQAQGVLFPSQYEGFGLPILEAAARGKPIIASPLDVFRELGLGEEWLVDFENVAALAKALRQPGPVVLARSPLSWQQCARQTWAVLRQAAHATDNRTR